MVERQDQVYAAPPITEMITAVQMIFDLFILTSTLKSAETPNNLGWRSQCGKGTIGKINAGVVIPRLTT